MVGIDLGTTNSLVAHFVDGHPEILVNELNEGLTPSAVAVAQDGTLLVGRAAKDRLINAPESGRSFFKRDMGTAASYQFGGRRWTPVECSAVVLREMKRIAELRLGHEVDRAVITVPAYFLDQQRQATVEAAQIAGLKVERLLNEPTAAALAYGHQENPDLSTLLIFDLGGGTFDVTILECFEGVVEVKSSAGESRLGGEDYTDALGEWLRDKTKWKPEDMDAMRWRELVEQAKRDLSTADSTVIIVNGNEVPLSLADFGAATRELTARLRPVVRRCLSDAGITPAHLDGVLLVGGASRMPLIVSALAEDLQQPPSRSLDPDRVVALGAAVQSALIARQAAVRDLVLTDVCPHTLGVAISKQLTPGQIQDGYFSPLIDRNTTVPVSRSDTFHTLHPQQDEILLQVYQGEGRMVKDNQKIGQVRVPGMKSQPGQKRPGEVDVRFTYDMNGILEVEVTILHSGQKVSEVFEQRPGTMSKEEIRDAIARLTPLKVHPRDAPPHRARLERAERLYQDLRSVERSILTALIDQFERALSSQEPAQIRASAEELDSFMSPYFRDEA
ncbi:MAG: Hsp70 family protein [Verrucomicrobiales bacterium]|nr:Hsp70 family protein [Verrucomicrobiales bacterium]MCP5558622.1 Hsp70 family protein [Verrucomicrobiaceae bacterium]